MSNECFLHRICIGEWLKKHFIVGAVKYRATSLFFYKTGYTFCGFSRLKWLGNLHSLHWNDKAKTLKTWIDSGEIRKIFSHRFRYCKVVIVKDRVIFFIPERYFNWFDFPFLLNLKSNIGCRIFFAKKLIEWALSHTRHLHDTDENVTNEDVTSGIRKASDDWGKLHQFGDQAK